MQHDGKSNERLAFCKILLHNASMLIRGLAKLEKFLRRHAAARTPMARWIEIAEPAEWRSIVDIHRVLPHGRRDSGSLTLLNIGGGNFRLLVVLAYQRQEVLIDELMTHAEYTRKYVR